MEPLDEQLAVRVDQYIENLLIPSDEVLQRTLSAASEAAIPGINVSAVQGKLLYLIARIAGARRILEVGTLAGYSAIWLARALPRDGSLLTLEVDPGHAAVARGN